MFKRIMLLLVTYSLCHAEAEILPDHPQWMPILPKEEKKANCYYFVSSQWCLMPGAGLSLRPEGYSLDATGTVFLFGGGVSLSGSKMFYFWQTPVKRQYLSVGAGCAYIASVNWLGSTGKEYPGLVLPVRWGRESEHGFFDIGTGALVTKGRRSTHVLPLLEFRLGGKF